MKRHDRLPIRSADFNDRAKFEDTDDLLMDQVESVDEDWGNRVINFQTDELKKVAGDDYLKQTGDTM